jgi:hypothetical protein
MNYLRRSMAGIAYWRFSCRTPHRVPTNLQRQSSHSSNPFDKAQSELVQGTALKKPTCVRVRTRSEPTQSGPMFKVERQWKVFKRLAMKHLT